MGGRSQVRLSDRVALFFLTDGPDTPFWPRKVNDGKSRKMVPLPDHLEGRQQINSNPHDTNTGPQEMLKGERHYSIMTLMITFTWQVANNSPISTQTLWLLLDGINIDGLL